MKKQRITILLSLLLLSVNVLAQQITVKSFGQANQFIPSENQLKDWDNEPCALVKIQGARIDSVSGAFEVIKQSAETWAYMTNGDKKLTIYKQGYEPCEVVFKSHGVDDVKSNKVYLMTIYAPELVKQRFFIGLFGGVNFSTSGLKSDYVGSAGWATGVHVGVRATYMFNDLIGASVGLFFANKGYTYTNEDDRQTIIDEKGDFQFLDIPVQAQLHFGLSDHVALQLLAGPCFSLNVGGKAKCDQPYFNEKFSDLYSTFQMGGQLGFRFVFVKHYAVGADYQFGFSDYKGQFIGINVGYIF